LESVRLPACEDGVVAPEKVEGNITIMLIPNMLHGAPICVLSNVYYNFCIADFKIQGNALQVRCVHLI